MLRGLARCLGHARALQQQARTCTTAAHYAPTATVTHSLPQFIDEFHHLEAGARYTDATVAVSGRVLAKRQASAKLVFYTMRSGGATTQVMATLGQYEGDKEAFVAANAAISRGDVILAKGIPAKSKKGELSVVPRNLQVLASCQHDIPTDFYGLADTDTRYRRRYLDLIINTDVREVFVKRSHVLTAMRGFLTSRGFLEVETPTLSPSAGGASARPFRTRAHALGTELQLRVAPELFLKQCVIGGMERVFELGKVFRNEGISPHHSPEFTSCEFYQAYADLKSLMWTTEDMLLELCSAVTGSDGVTLPDGTHISFTAPFARIDVVSALEEAFGCRLPLGNSSADAAAIMDVCAANEVPMPGLPHTVPRLFDAMIEHVLEPRCTQPTFLCGHPSVMSPLAHEDPDRPGITQRFELYVAGKELANAYVELNDPAVQRQRFAQQAEARDCGDKEAQAMDEAFCTALEYGLPPTGGWGLGVDRLVMLLTGQTTIKDVVLFPPMRPRENPPALEE